MFLGRTGHLKTQGWTSQTPQTTWTSTCWSVWITKHSTPMHTRSYYSQWKLSSGRAVGGGGQRVYEVWAAWVEYFNGWISLILRADRFRGRLYLHFWAQEHQRFTDVKSVFRRSVLIPLRETRRGRSELMLRVIHLPFMLHRTLTRPLWSTKQMAESLPTL